MAMQRACSPSRRCALVSPVWRVLSVAQAAASQPGAQAAAAQAEAKLRALQQQAASEGTPTPADQEPATAAIAGSRKAREPRGIEQRIVQVTLEGELSEYEGNRALVLHELSRCAHGEVVRCVAGV